MDDGLVMQLLGMNGTDDFLALAGDDNGLDNEGSVTTMQGLSLGTHEWQDTTTKAKQPTRSKGDGKQGKALSNAEMCRRSRDKRRREQEVLSARTKHLEVEQELFKEKISTLEMELQALTSSASLGLDGVADLELENRILRDEVRKHRKLVHTIASTVSDELYSPQEKYLLMRRAAASARRQMLGVARASALGEAAGWKEYKPFYLEACGVDLRGRVKYLPEGSTFATCQRMLHVVLHDELPFSYEELTGLMWGAERLLTTTREFYKHETMRDGVQREVVDILPQAVKDVDKEMASPGTHVLLFKHRETVNGKTREKIMSSAVERVNVKPGAVGLHSLGRDQNEDHDGDKPRKGLMGTTSNTAMAEDFFSKADLEKVLSGEDAGTLCHGGDDEGRVQHFENNHVTGSFFLEGLKPGTCQSVQVMNLSKDWFETGVYKQIDEFVLSDGSVHPTVRLNLNTYWHVMMTLRGTGEVRATSAFASMDDGLEMLEELLGELPAGKGAVVECLESDDFVALASADNDLGNESSATTTLSASSDGGSDGLPLEQPLEGQQRHGATKEAKQRAKNDGKQGKALSNAEMCRRSRDKRRREQEILSTRTKHLEVEQELFKEKISTLEMELQALTSSPSLGLDGVADLEMENRILRDEVRKHRKLVHTIASTVSDNLYSPQEKYLLMRRATASARRQMLGVASAAALGEAAGWKEHKPFYLEACGVDLRGRVKFLPEGSTFKTCHRIQHVVMYDELPFKYQELTELMWGPDRLFSTTREFFKHETMRDGVKRDVIDILPQAVKDVDRKMAPQGTHVLLFKYTEKDKGKARETIMSSAVERIHVKPGAVGLRTPECNPDEEHDGGVPRIGLMGSTSNTAMAEDVFPQADLDKVLSGQDEIDLAGSQDEEEESGPCRVQRVENNHMTGSFFLEGPKPGTCQGVQVMNLSKDWFETGVYKQIDEFVLSDGSVHPTVQLVLNAQWQMMMTLHGDRLNAE
ncbi:Uncharacterized protein SCF082_LOCUS1773 [Durusdinium trenchii]|uniref:Uncharacterized protein n=1 Tax=Durusdinium trenchii TaxID=1381693 RepID=A0ABP0HJM7_9DINO